MASITSTGLGSGLDINGLVGQLVDLEREPKEARLNSREGEIQATISSLGNFRSAISDFKSSLSGLTTVSSFQKITATSSNEDIITASAEKNADLGSYQLEVKQLAQSHSIASGAYDTADSIVGSGTLSIKFGTTDYDVVSDTYTSFTENTELSSLDLTIDSSNNTLTGLRDAINNADAGVNASIINDGIGFRLVLNSTDTGAARSLQLSVTDDIDANDTDNVGLSALSFNDSVTHMEQTQGAQDANLSINGLAISSESNSVSSALKGVTFELKQAQVDTIVSMNISRDNGGVKESIESFVTSYNELLQTVGSVSGVDLESKTAGILVGDAMLRGTMSRIRREMTGFVEGLSGSVRALSDIGVGFQRDGTLGFDDSKLSSALTNSPDQVAQLFTALGSTQGDGVSYLTHSNDTQSGNYAVNVSQAASSAILSGASLGAADITIDTDNDTFSLKVDGNQSNVITLTAGSYTKAELVTEMQARIDEDTELKAGSVKVSYDTDTSSFVFTAASIGSSSSVELTALDTNTELTMGLSLASSVGKDMLASIAGSAVTVDGFNVTADDGAAKGLKVLIEENSVGSKGNISFSRGLIGQLNSFLGSLLNGEGSISQRTDTLQQNLREIEGDREDLDKRIESLESRLFSQFNSLDLLMARFQSTSTFLTQQLDNLPLSSSNRDN